MPDLARDVLRLLERRGATLATAESLTGGQVAAALTAVPGASAVYRGGVVSYATEVKVDVLGVARSVVDGPGVISRACAAAMAEGAARLTGATHAVATTGVAGPAEQEGHPAGTVVVGTSGPRGTSTRWLRLSGDRAAVQAATVEAALSELRDILTEE